MKDLEMSKEATNMIKAGAMVSSKDSCSSTPHGTTDCYDPDTGLHKDNEVTMPDYDGCDGYAQLKVRTSSLIAF